MDENSPFELTKENENSATKDELKFIFSQAEALLKESLSSGDSVLTRSTILLSVLLGIFTSIIGYIVSIYNTIPTINKLMATLIIVGLFTAFLLYRLSFNLYGKVYKATGSQPKDLFHDWYFDNHKDESVRERSFIINEIKSYQERIKFNNDLNKNRWDCFHFTLKLTTIIPIVFIFCYVIFLVFLR